MPRAPYDVPRARRLLRQWLEESAARPAADAPITREAAAEHLTRGGLPTHPATLTKYKLVAGLGEARRRQTAGAGRRRRDGEASAYHAQLDELRRQVADAEHRGRELLAEIATMTYNARRLGVPHAELARAIPRTDRSRSRAGVRRRAAT